MKQTVLCILLAVLILLGLTACTETPKSETIAAEVPESTAATTEPAAETTVPQITQPESVLLTQNVDNQVCVGFVPTEAGYWRYAVIEDQQAAVSAFEKAVNAVYSDEWWIKGDRTMGLMVAYNGEFWDFVESGELVCAVGRVKAEDAAELLALCTAAAKEAGWKEAVAPEHLTGIVSAVLAQEETSFSLSDPGKLAQLEAMVSAGTFSLGGTGCPFNALLTVETEAGETHTIALATDSCGVWMSEGDYYEFASDSQPLYDLFGVKSEYGTLTAK